MRPLIWTLATTFVISLTSTPCTADDDCLNRYVDRASLARLVQAKSKAVLETNYRSLPFHDELTDVLYATMSARFSKSKQAQLRLIATLPRSPLEFAYLYRLTYPAQPGGVPDRELETVFSEYLRAAANAVMDQQRGTRDFLLLNRFADGETLDAVQELSGEMLKRDRQRFLKAFQQTDALTQRRFCGDRQDSFCKASD